MQNFLKITFKHWKKIISISLLTCLSSVIFGLIYNQTPQNATLFMNIGAKTAISFDTVPNPYDTVQSADFFTESIQGWFKNPLFIESIRTKSGFNVDFSIRKQEKQNLIATYKTNTPDQAEKVSHATQELLNSYLTRYNRETGSDFRIATFDFYSKTAAIPLLIFALLGITLGLMLGYGISALYEKIISELHYFHHGKWI